MKCEQHKVRKSKFSEEGIAEIAEALKKNYMGYSEIYAIARKYDMKSGIESLLSLFAVRGYQIAEKSVTYYSIDKKIYVKRTLYKIVTKEDYEKYEMEATKDAKRRLLAAVSCGSTF